MSEIFRRVEKKYIINKEQYKKIKETILEYMVEDQYGKSTICNVYFDTDNYDLIRHSTDKPYYKDKVRLRSYNVPNEESKVYLEIKKKCDGVVGKRRIEMKLKEFNEYLENPESLEVQNKQIKRELDYYFKYYNLKPKMYLSYIRRAYYQKDNNDFRLTFDNSILARDYNVKLEAGSEGTNILNPNYYAMEIKTLGAIPMWFVKVINEMGLKPQGFSKYGEAYRELVVENDNENEELTGKQLVG